MPESAPRNELELIDLGEWGRVFGPEQLVQIHESTSTSQIGRFETEWLAEANLTALADPSHVLRGSPHPSVMTLSLRVFLRTPHATMPDLMLIPDETDDIISYILTLMLNALKGDQ
jgi:hypothetical protein